MKLPELSYLQYLEGTTFYIIVFLVILILKFAKVIHWPWIWIFSPLWIPLGIPIIGILISLPFFLIDHLKEKK